MLAKCTFTIRVQNWFKVSLFLSLSLSMVGLCENVATTNLDTAHFSRLYAMGLLGLGSAGTTGELVPIDMCHYVCKPIRSRIMALSIRDNDRQIGAPLGYLNLLHFTSLNYAILSYLDSIVSVVSRESNQATESFGGS